MQMATRVSLQMQHGSSQAPAIDIEVCIPCMPAHSDIVWYLRSPAPKVKKLAARSTDLQLLASGPDDEDAIDPRGV